MTALEFDEWASGRAKTWKPFAWNKAWVEPELCGEDDKSSAAMWARYAIRGYNQGMYFEAHVCLQYAAYYQRRYNDWLAMSEDAPLTDEDRYGTRGAEYVQQAEDRACSANGGK